MRVPKLLETIDRPATARFRPLWALAVFYLLLGLVARIVLWTRFGTAADVPAMDLPLLLAGGAVNDAVESLYLFAPFALYLLLMPDRWYRTVVNRTLLGIGTALAIGGLLYLAVAEVFFFEEFDARFNLVAFDYLAYPTEVFVDIWEAYPVVQVLLATALLAVGATWLLRRRWFAGLDSATRLTGRLVPFALHAVALAMAIAWYPTNALSWSSNRVANEILQNGHSSFFRAAATNEIDYHAYYATRDPRANLDLLVKSLGADGGQFTRLAEGRLDRKFPARADGLGRLNVVVVSSESFGAEFSKLHGSRRDLTPNFDAYARRGVWFSNTYASGTRTVRGLEALTASFPPIPTVSILRRPGNDGIATWGRVMRDLGYQTSFLYGGYGYFDDMNAFYAGNGYTVLDRKDIEHVRFENIWGVSDEDLFDRAIEHFSDLHARHQPFFSIVMTTFEPQAVHVPPRPREPRHPARGWRPRGGRAVRGLRDRPVPAPGREAAVVRRHDLRRRGRPRRACLRQGRDPDAFLRDPADGLLAEAPRAPAGGYADEPDRTSRPPCSACSACPTRRRSSGRTCCTRPRRPGWRCSATTTTWRSIATASSPCWDWMAPCMTTGMIACTGPSSGARRMRGSMHSASRTSRRPRSSSGPTTTSEGASIMSKGMDQKKEAKKKPKKTKEEKRAEKKAKKGG